MQVTKNFKLDEFQCKCCGKNNISIELIKQLQTARDIASIPFVITSGYRCNKHNKEVGGVADSSHVKGLAVDVAVKSDSDRFILLDAFIKAGFERIGIAKNFIHVDIDKSKKQKVIWLY